jgi:hypothetical protein
MVGIMYATLAFYCHRTYFYTYSVTPARFQCFKSHEKWQCSGDEATFAEPPQILAGTDDFAQFTYPYCADGDALNKTI